MRDFVFVSQVTNPRGSNQILFSLHHMYEVVGKQWVLSHAPDDANSMQIPSLFFILHIKRSWSGYDARSDYGRWWNMMYAHIKRSWSRYDSHVWTCREWAHPPWLPRPVHSILPQTQPLMVPHPFHDCMVAPSPERGCNYLHLWRLNELCPFPMKHNNRRYGDSLASVLRNLGDLHVSHTEREVVVFPWPSPKYAFSI